MTTISQLRTIGRAVATAAAFTPAGRGSQAALAVGGKAALTETAIQTGQKAAGGEFDAADVAIAGLGGLGSQALANQLIKRIPVLAAADDFEVTDDVRNVVREEAIKLGFKPEELTDEVVAGLVDQVRRQTRPGQALAIQGEREFDIPLTSGQRSLDDAALSFEDRARYGQLGEKAQRPLREFEKQEQIPAARRAVEDVRGRVSDQPVAARAISRKISRIEPLVI